MEKRTKVYEHELLGCRFCPMCKPASDSLNASLLECHATRAHAMIIWRVMDGIKDYTEKEAELLYQCNLDGVAEAFCVDHYPMTKIMLAAREDIVDAGKEPAPVKVVLKREQAIAADPKGDMLVFAEGCDLVTEAATEAKKIADKLGAGIISGCNGYLPYVLGGRAKAIKEAKEMAEAITKTGAKTLVAPGPESFYTFTKLYEELGVVLPVKVVSLTELRGNKPAQGVQGKKVFFHDARAAYNLGDTKPDEKVIMPDFFGPEELLGEGAVYDLPRKALKDGGAQLLFSVWSRAMANAMGNDEGVSITYPKMAQKMAARRLRMISELGTEVLVTDSMATYLYLEQLPEELKHGMSVKFLGDL